MLDVVHLFDVKYPKTIYAIHQISNRKCVFPLYFLYRDKIGAISQMELAAQSGPH